MDTLYGLGMMAGRQGFDSHVTHVGIVFRAVSKYIRLKHEIQLLYEILTAWSAPGTFVGGVLYEYGGFYLPFMVNGGFLVLCSCYAFVLYKTKQKSKPEINSNDDANADDVNKTKFATLLKIPAVVYSCIILGLSGISCTWFLPTLQVGLSIWHMLWMAANFFHHALILSCPFFSLFWRLSSIWALWQRVPCWWWMVSCTRFSLLSGDGSLMRAALVHIRRSLLGSCASSLATRS